MSMLISDYGQGKIAYANGENLKDNPNSKTLKKNAYRWWNIGWRTARNIDKLKTMPIRSKKYITAKRHL